MARYRPRSAARAPAPETTITDSRRPATILGRLAGEVLTVALEPSKLSERVRLPSPALDSRPGFRSGGVESPTPRGVAQSGSAPGWGPGGRRFKSCLPDHTTLLRWR